MSTRAVSSGTKASRRGPIACRYRTCRVPADFDRLALPQGLTPLVPYLARAQRALRLGPAFISR